MADKSPEQITIDTLTKENTTLKKELKEAQELRDQYAAKRDELQVQNNALKDANAQLATENAQLTEDLDKAETLITEQTDKLANAVLAQGTNPQVIVTHEGKKYRVLGKKLNVDGKSVLVADLVDNQELVAKLVETGSGLLREIQAQ